MSKTYETTCKLSEWGLCDQKFVTTTQIRKQYCCDHHKRRYATLNLGYHKTPLVEFEEDPNPYDKLPSKVPDDTLFRREEERQVVVRIDDVIEGERAIYLADGHGPFGDDPLMGAVEKFMYDFQPHRIFYMGDMCDFYTVSTFDQNPTRRFGLNDEVVSIRAMLDRHAQIVHEALRKWLDGNHEYRLIRELMKAGGEFYDLIDEDTGDPLISIPKVLGLRKRNVDYIPYSGRIDYAGFTLTHGGKSPVTAKHVAKWMLESVKSSGLSAHVHRNQIYCSVGDKGQSQGWIVQGCLCHLNPYYSPFPDWQQGFTYSTVIKGQVHPTLVSVFDNAFTANGKSYIF